MIQLAGWLPSKQKKQTCNHLHFHVLEQLLINSFMVVWLPAIICLGFVSVPLSVTGTAIQFHVCCSDFSRCLVELCGHSARTDYLAILKPKRHILLWNNQYGLAGLHATFGECRQKFIITQKSQRTRKNMCIQKYKANISVKPPVYQVLF